MRVVPSNMFHVQYPPWALRLVGAFEVPACRNRRCVVVLGVRGRLHHTHAMGCLACVSSNRWRLLCAAQSKARACERQGGIATTSGHDPEASPPSAAQRSETHVDAAAAVGQVANGGAGPTHIFRRSPGGGENYGGGGAAHWRPCIPIGLPLQVKLLVWDAGR